MPTSESPSPAVCAWQGTATLGECPVWDPARAVLWWIDCAEPALHRFDPATGSDRALPLVERIQAIGLRRDGGLIAAMASGIARLDPDGGVVEMIAKPEAGRPDHRFNDGKCGPDGCFWIGSMHHGYAEPSGCLYRIEPDATATAVLDHLTVPNGVGWSPDGDVFYLGDSPTGVISAFDFDPAEGILATGARRLTEPGVAPGWPDGLAVDAEGFLWNARWDGGCIARFAPDGRLDRTVPMPVSRPTSCAFGGPALDRLYVTSARIGLDAPALADQPLAGSLFALDVGVAGAPVATFGG